MKTYVDQLRDRIDHLPEKDGLNKAQRLALATYLEEREFHPQVGPYRSHHRGNRCIISHLYDSYLVTFLRCVIPSS